MTEGIDAGHQVLASYPTYADAQAVVDMLAERDFPLTGVRIIGAELRLVEDVLGRLTTGRAALAGAATGAWIGLLISVVISLGTPYLLPPLLWGMGWGVVFGAIIGAVAHLAWPHHKEYASLRRLVATRYEVLVPAHLLLRAQSLLGYLDGRAPAATP